MNRRKLFGTLLGLPGVLSLGGLTRIFDDKYKNWKWGGWSPGPGNIRELVSNITAIDWEYIDREMSAFLYFNSKDRHGGGKFLTNAVREYLKNDVEVIYRGRISEHGYVEYPFRDDDTHLKFYSGTPPHNIITKQLGVRWSPEFVQDINTCWSGGILPEQEFGRVLVEYVGEELKFQKDEFSKDGKIQCWGFEMTDVANDDYSFTPKSKGLIIKYEK